MLQEKEKEKKEKKERVPAKRKAPAPTKTNGHVKYVRLPLRAVLNSFLYLRRVRRKRNFSDDEDDANDPEATAQEDSDVEMADIHSNKPRKSDASEGGRQTRAERLSARTQAKVCLAISSCHCWV